MHLKGILKALVKIRLKRGFHRAGHCLFLGVTLSSRLLQMELTEAGEAIQGCNHFQPFKKIIHVHTCTDDEEQYF